MGALRHHAARTRALALGHRHAEQPGGIVRAWLRALLAALRMNSARQFLLRTMLGRPATRRSAARGKTAARLMNRHPMRIAASAEWFAFGGR